jgi:toxin ParE1/3/4
MRKVVWTLRARADLKAIHDRIAQKSPLNAKRIAREIRLKAQTLAGPLSRPGRKVAEVNDPDLRETPIYSWRIIFYLRPDLLFIVTLIHKRRKPGVDDLLPALPDYVPPSN